MPVALLLTLALAGCTEPPPAGGNTTAPPTFQGYTYAGGPHPMVVVSTTHGPFILEVFTDQTPQTANNFLNLTKAGFYDGLRFHRVIGPAKAPPNGWFVQSGDNLSRDLNLRERWGFGGANVTVPDEIPRVNGSLVLRFDAPGILAMANRGPNTANSQFFITLNQTSWLNGNYTIFGQVIAGFETIRAIGNLPTDPGDRPTQDAIIQRAAVYRPEPPGNVSS